MQLAVLHGYVSQDGSMLLGLATCSCSSMACSLSSKKVEGEVSQ